MVRFFASMFSIMFLGACATPYLGIEQVPKHVINRLQQEYVGVKMLHWQKENKQYIATFKRASHTYCYIFDEKATILQRREEIPLQQVPTLIVEKVKQLYPSYRLRKATWVLAKEKDTCYVAEIQRGMKFYHVYFSTKAKHTYKEVFAPENEPLRIDTSMLRGF